MTGSGRTSLKLHDRGFFAQVFGNPKWPPEAEFDCFAAIGGPTGSEFEQRVLLRIDLGATKGRITAKNMHVYVVISAIELYRYV